MVENHLTFQPSDPRLISMENFLHEEGIDYERKEFVAEGGWIELHFDERETERVDAFFVQLIDDSHYEDSDYPEPAFSRFLSALVKLTTYGIYGILVLLDLSFAYLTYTEPVALNIGALVVLLLMTGFLLWSNAFKGH